MTSELYFVLGSLMAYSSYMRKHTYIYRKRVHMNRRGYVSPVPAFRYNIYIVYQLDGSSGIFILYTFLLYILYFILAGWLADPSGIFILYTLYFFTLYFILYTGWLTSFPPR